MDQCSFETIFCGQQIKAFYIKEAATAVEFVDALMQKDVLFGLDTETAAHAQYRNRSDAALSPHLARIRLLQIFDGKNAIVFDLDAIRATAGLELFLEFLETKRFMAHYAQFDLGMLRSTFGIKRIHIGCTQILYRIVSHAVYPVDIGAASLEALCDSILKVPLPKAAQRSDWNERDLTFEQVEYSAIDPVAVIKIAEKLAHNLKKYSLQATYQLAKDVQHPIVEMQLNGMQLDVITHQAVVGVWGEQLWEARKILEKFTGIKNITDPALGKWLEENLSREETLIWPRTETGKFSTSAHAFAEFSYLPIVKPIAVYKKLEKLSSSFGNNLIAMINPATRRIHTHFNIAGARTGRLSSSKPNMQQYPNDNELRSHFIPPPGMAMVCADFCFTGDTLIDTPNGDVPIADLSMGDLVFTYRKGRPAVGTVDQHLLIGKAPCVEVLLDNGSAIRCTAEHKFLQLFNEGVVKKVKAGDLLPGDRLLPLKRVTAQGYTHLYSHGYFQYSKEHRVVAEAAYGECPEGCEVHHVNGDRTDNTPDNLEYKNVQEHRSAHSKVNYQAQDHALRLQNLKRGLKNRRSYSGEGNPRWGKRKGPDLTCLYCKKDFYKPPCYQAKFCTHDCYTRAKNVGLNCKVVSVTPIEGLHDVYSIAVSPDRNYALSAGVFVSNSQIEVRVAAEISQDQKMLNIYKNGLDIYSATAAHLTNQPIESIHKQSRERKIAKALVLGLLFGLGAAKFSHYAKKGYEIDVSHDEATENIQAFRDLYETFRWWQLAQAKRCKLELTVRTVGGKARRLADDNFYGPGLNHPVQGTAAEIIFHALVKLHADFLDTDVRLVNCVHDEIIVECQPEEALDVAELMKIRMTESYQELFPQGITRGLVNVDVGTSWGEAKPS